MKRFNRIYLSQFIWINSVVAIGLVISIISPSPYLNFALLLLAIFALSGVMPSEFSNLRIVYAFTYLSVGFGIYLILRGFVLRGLFELVPISKYDFAICILILTALALLPKILGRNTSGTSFKPLKFSFVTGSTTLVFCLAFGAHLMSKGIGYFLAWSGSGDSSNQVRAFNFIARKGFLDLFDLTWPYLPNVISVFLNSGTPPEIGSDTSTLLMSDWTSQALTWGLLIAMMGYAFAAVWEVVLPVSSRRSVFLMLAPASALAFTSLSLGTFLLDGFISATAGAISVAFATAILFENSTKSSSTNLFSLITVAMLALFSWTFVVIPVLIMMIPLYIKWLDLSSKSFWMMVRLASTILGTVISLYLFTTHYFDYFTKAIGKSGTISPAPAKAFIIFLLIIVLSMWLSSKTKSPTFVQLGLVPLSAVSFILILNKASGIPLTDLNYYSTKAMMILFVGFLPTGLIFIPIGLLLMYRNYSFSAVRLSIVCVLIGVLTHMAAQYISPYARIVGQINDGWQGPNSNTVSQVLSVRNDPLKPTVFFDYLPLKSDENRLANFWLGTYVTELGYYQTFSYLSGAEQAGDYPAFCFLNSAYPQMTVYTRDENLRSKMRAYCRDEKMIINVIK